MYVYEFQSPLDNQLGYTPAADWVQLLVEYWKALDEPDRPLAEVAEFTAALGEAAHALARTGRWQGDGSWLVLPLPGAEVDRDYRNCLVFAIKQSHYGRSFLVSPVKMDADYQKPWLERIA